MSGRRALAAAVLAALGIALTAAAVASRADPDAFEQPAAPVAIGGGTAAERGLVRRTLQGYGRRRRIAQVEVGIPPRGFDRSGGARWLTITAPGTLEPASRVEAEWQADVLLASVRRAARDRGWRPFRGSTFRLRLPGGEVVSSSAVAGRWTAVATRTSPDAVARLLHGAAARADVRLEELSFLRPERLAVGVRVVAGEPKRFVCDSDQRLTAFLDAIGRPDGRRLVEGLFVDVRNARGESILAFGGALGGLVYVREDLRAHYPPRSVDEDVRRRYAELCTARSPSRLREHGEDLVALPLHQLARARLEVQP